MSNNTKRTLTTFGIAVVAVVAVKLATKHIPQVRNVLA